MRRIVDAKQFRAKVVAGYGGKELRKEKVRFAVLR